MSTNIDFHKLISKANAIVETQKIATISAQCVDNTVTATKASESLASKESLFTEKEHKPEKSATSDDSVVTKCSSSEVSRNPEFSMILNYKEENLWHPSTPVKQNMKFNGHFYDSHRPLATAISFYPEHTIFYYSDGHIYSTDWGNYGTEIILNNIGAATVLKLSSKFETDTMQEHFLVEAIKNCFENENFWDHAVEVVIDGSWQSCVLKTIVKNLPKKIETFSLINYTVHGTPAFDVEDIVNNRTMSNIQHLSFNSQGTNYTDIYGNIKLLKSIITPLESLFIQGDGMPSTSERMQSMIKGLHGMLDKTKYGKATVLTTEHVDDRIYGWLNRMDFEYAGKTKKMVYNTEPQQFQYYDTFNQRSNDTMITLGFLARN